MPGDPFHTETERIVSDIWNDVLRTPLPPGPADSFFALGGESIAMGMVLFRIQERYSVELPPATLLRNPTLGALCAALDAAIAESQRAVT